MFDPTKISIVSLSGIYETETFYKDVKGLNFIDLRSVTGTNCMCDDAAKEILTAAISGGNGEETGEDVPKAFGGLHYIDNGNYHYLSAIYLEFVKEPFSLVVLDHHPDMQAPMFDILSCGGWVLHVLENNPFVRDIHIIGADAGLISQLDEKIRKRVKFYEKSKVFDSDGNLSLPETEFPVYLSIDKDVIARDELTTNWDQGEFTASQVIAFMKELFWREEGKEGRGIIGIDICGECAPEQEDCDLEAAIAANNAFNENVIQYFVRDNA